MIARTGWERMFLLVYRVRTTSGKQSIPVSRWRVTAGKRIRCRVKR